MEQFLLKIRNLRYLHLQNNKIKDFQNSSVLKLSLAGLYLSSNLISDLPINFFPNVQVLDLSRNSIGTKGAYNISTILQNKETRWVELNLNDNVIQTEGFIAIVYALVSGRGCV